LARRVKIKLADGPTREHNTDTGRGQNPFGSQRHLADRPLRALAPCRVGALG